MKSPLGYTFLKILTYLRLTFQALLIALVLFMLSSAPEAGSALYGFRKGILEALTQTPLMAISREMVLEAIGALCFPAALIGGIVFFLHKRSYRGVLIMTILVLFSDLAHPGLGILLSALQLGILVISKPTKACFKQKMNNHKERYHADLGNP